MEVSRRCCALEQLLGDQCVVFGVFQEWTDEETWEIESVSEESEEGWEFLVCYSSFELPFIQFLCPRVNGDSSDDNV